MLKVPRRSVLFLTGYSFLQKSVEDVEGNHDSRKVAGEPKENSSLWNTVSLKGVTLG